MTESGHVVDTDTGEISEQYGTFITHEEALRRKEHYNNEMKKNEIAKLKLISENNMLREKYNDKSEIDKTYPHFIWMYFQEMQNLFPDLKAHDLSRLIFLSTYCDYNTNILVDNRKPIHKDDLCKLMALNRGVFNPWLDKMVIGKYISFKNDQVILNKNFFSRGKLSKNNDIKAIRIFIDMIRELYLNLKPDDHHKMGLVIRLIPYINPYFNCLAKNPYEKDKLKLIPLKLGELAENLGYSSKQCRRLGNEILSIRFGADSKKIAAAVALNNLETKNLIWLFNAKLFFGGNIEEYKTVNSILENYESIDILELDM